jgi:hypothetical protein
MHPLPPLLDTVRALQLALLEPAASQLETLMPGLRTNSRSTHHGGSLAGELRPHAGAGSEPVIQHQQDTAVCPLGAGAWPHALPHRPDACPPFSFQCARSEQPRSRFRSGLRRRLPVRGQPCWPPIFPARRNRILFSTPHFG